MTDGGAHRGLRTAHHQGYIVMALQPGMDTGTLVQADAPRGLARRESTFSSLRHIFRVACGRDQIDDIFLDGL